MNRHTLPSGDWKTYSDCLTPIIERLRGVVIENKNALDVIATHDGEQTLHYLDPPYPLETRDPGVDYQHEMTTDQHRELAAFVRTLKGAVVISGYACQLYDEELFPDWDRRQREALGDGAVKRTEVVWINDAAGKARSQKILFDAEPECPDCVEAAKHANSDATTPGFFYDKCEKHRGAA